MLTDPLALDLHRSRLNVMTIKTNFRLCHVPYYTRIRYNGGVLIIRNLKVSIGEQEILHGLSLKIKPGEIHAVMGPNGSGKSTLAYTLAGHPSYQVQPKSAVKLDGENLLELSPDERARAGLFLAFQYPTEIPGLSVQNFLRAMWEARFGKFGPKSRFASVLEFRQYLSALAQEMGVKPELLKRNLNEGFSGGERKRVEVFQMAVFEPRYAILDETDSGLDIDAVKTVAKGAREVVDRFNSGVLVITHYQRILRFLQPDFVHVLSGGKIAASGGPELAVKLEKEGYKQYQNS